MSDEVMRIKDAIDDAITYRVEADPKVIYVTEVCGCLRYAYFQRMIPKRLTKPMIDGIIIHGIIEDKIRKVGSNCIVEVPVEYTINGVTIRGKVDVLCDEFLIELKTSNKYGIRDEWINQVQLYMFITGRPKAYIAVIRDKSTWVEEINYDSQRAKWLIDRALKLSEHIVNSIPPPPERGWLCKYCPFKKYCKGDTSIDRFK